MILMNIIKFGPSYKEVKAELYSDEWYAAVQEQDEKQRTAREKLGNILDAGFIHLMQNMFEPGEENNVFSPLALGYSLLTLIAATKGKTRQEILDLLKLKSIDTKKIQQLLQQCIAGNLVGNKTELANAVWANDLFISENFAAENLAKALKADIGVGRFGEKETDEQIHKWINEHTGNLLKAYSDKIEMSKEGILEILTTLYFYSPWYYKFNKSATKTGYFHVTPSERTKVQFMKKIKQGFYHEYHNFTAVTEDLRGGYKMNFLLPKNGIDPVELLKDADVMEYFMREERDEAEWVFIKMKVPRFDVKCKIDMEKKLKQLGVSRIFMSGEAELDEKLIDIPGVYLSKAQQVSRVKVNEDGIEGASFVEFGPICAGLPPKLREFEFYLDRPFLFSVMKNEGIPLFVGVVKNPGII